MGAWGCRAFQNDETLDAVGTLCAFDGTINALYRAIYLNKQEIVHDGEFEIAYGACEIVAAGAGAPRGQRIRSGLSSRSSTSNWRCR